MNKNQEKGSPCAHFIGERLDNSRYVIQDKLGMVVAQGQCNMNSLNGLTSVYMYGKKIMTCEYDNNDRNGKYVEYTDGQVTRTATYCKGNLSSIDRQFDRETHTFSENDGVNIQTYRGNVTHCQTKQGGHQIAEGGSSTQSISTRKVIEYETCFSRSDSNGTTSLYTIPHHFHDLHSVSTLQLNSFKTDETFVLRSYNKQSKKLQVFETIPEYSSPLPPLPSSSSSSSPSSSFSSSSSSRSSVKRFYEGRCNPTFATRYAREGRGREEFPNGISLIGQFKNDRIDGDANFLDKRGRCFCRGGWEQGQLKRVTFFNKHTEKKYTSDFQDWSDKLDASALAKEMEKSPNLQKVYEEDEMRYLQYSEIRLDQGFAIPSSPSSLLLIKTGVLDFSPFLLVRQIYLTTLFPSFIKTISIVHLPCLESIEVVCPTLQPNLAHSTSTTMTDSEYRHGYDEGRYAGLKVEDRVRKQDLLIAHNPCLTKVKFYNNTCPFVTGMYFFGRLLK